MSRGGVPEIDEIERVKETKRTRKAKTRKERPRIPTGIEKLDQFLQGGIPQGSWVFIAGEPGTGKTILCLHIAYSALKEGNDVIYVTTEQPFRDLIEQAQQFNISLLSFLKDTLYVVDLSLIHI